MKNIPLSLSSTSSATTAGRSNPAFARSGELTPRTLLLSITAVSVVLALWAFLSAANGLLSAAAILILPALFALLWRDNEPPALLFAITLQTLQASAAVFYTDYYGMSLTEASDSPDFQTATWLSLLSVLILAIGVRIGLSRTKRFPVEKVRLEARQILIPSLFLVYLTVACLATGVSFVAWRIPAIQQFLFATNSIKWVLVFVLAYSVMQQRRCYAQLGAMVALEFSTGLLGYFASFKGIFFLLLVVVLGTQYAFRPARLALTACVAMALFVSGVVWTAVKSEYREFVNEGTNQQAILVPVEERFEKLGDLVGNLTMENFNTGIEQMIMRVSYVKYFSLALNYVPSTVPHENGALWLGALKHIVTPRFLFPDKAAIDDSERTMYYTGTVVAGAEQGTSISIGYVGESYIDFGKIGMFVPIFVLGILYGSLYRVFVFRSRVTLIGLAIACVILIFGAYNIETSNIKIVGGMLTQIAVVSLFFRFLGGPLLRVIAPRLAETRILPS